MFVLPGLKTEQLLCKGPPPLLYIDYRKQIKEQLNRGHASPLLAVPHLVAHILVLLHRLLAVPHLVVHILFLLQTASSSSPSCSYSSPASDY